MPGHSAKKVTIRAIEPSLGGAEVEGPLADTVLELHDSTGAIIALNDNWKDAQQAEIEAAHLAWAMPAASPSSKPTTSKRAGPPASAGGVIR